MTERIDIKKLDNGMVIAGSPMEEVGSVGIDFFITSGAAVLPNACGGAAAVIKDWIFRGAGQYSSRELSDKLDGLGLHRGDKADSRHIIIGSAMEAGKVSDALSLYADIILNPKLDDEQFEFSKQLALSELAGIDDDPRQKTIIELKKQFYPDPLGRSVLGSKEELENITPQICRDIITENFNPAEMIFAIAGKYDFKAICGQIEKLFGSAKSRSPKEIFQKSYQPGHTHIDYDGSQVHIGLMCPAECVQGKDYYNIRVAVAVLSGGMSSRLFTEVREKRGLCYAVGANYNCLREMAGVSCYAGTTPQKAQKTYNVIISEFKKLGEGITEDELARAKAGLKSSLVMQGESSSARSLSGGSDYHLLGRIRTFEEIKIGIDSVTVDSVSEFLQANPFDNFTVVTIGPESIEYV